MSDKENDLFANASSTLFASKPSSGMDLGSSLLFSKPTGPAQPVEPQRYVVPTVQTATLNNGKKIVLKTRSQAANARKINTKEHFGIEIHKLLAGIRTEDNTTSKELAAPSAISTGDKLLSEAYRPKIWTDLIGSEKQHRMMLKWLVSWSHVVFGEQIKPEEKEAERAPKYDALGRPKRKILLITGPPGIGKTTVAHILAKQAGYESMEINASDERSGQVEGSDKKTNLLKTKIQNAVQSHRINASKKPVCIVADEIDGAAEFGLIRVLLELIKSDERALQATDTKPGFPNNKKEKAMLLQRPIIAVCNDAYAPALRELRQHAELVHYHRVQPNAVVSRLKDICAVEGIEADTASLKDVTEAMDGDLRSCLNMLQFGMKRDIYGKLVTKDVTQSLRTTTNRIFQRDKNLEKPQEAKQILELAHAYGEYDKLLNALFQSFPGKKFFDDLVPKPCAIGDWLYFHEQINRSVWKSQNFQLGAYHGHPILAFYNLFSSPLNTVTKTNEPSTLNDWEYFEQQNRIKQQLKEFSQRIDPETRHHLAGSATNFAMDVAPHVLQIVNCCPGDSVIKPAERARLTHAAHVMSKLNIRFKHDRLDFSGTAVFRIDPPYEQIVVFDEEDRQRVAVGAKFAVRSTIVNILDSLLPATASQSSQKRGRDELEEDINRPSAKTRKVIAPLKKKKDFFGREIVPKVVDVSDKEQPKQDDDRQKVWVQYVEGFSAAVRKDICWNELWGI